MFRQADHLGQPQMSPMRTVTPLTRIAVPIAPRTLPRCSKPGPASSVSNRADRRVSERIGHLPARGEGLYLYAHIGDDSTIRGR